jgi:hypothetical protein
MSSPYGICQHAQSFTSFPVTFPTPAYGGLLISNFAASASSITFTTLGGETVTMALGNVSASNNPYFLPIQIVAIVAVTNVGTVTALWN